MANLNVSVILGLVDRLSGPLRGVQQRLQRTSAALAVGGAGSVAAGYGLSRPLQAAAQEAMALEDAMADVRKVVDFPTPQGPAELQAQIEAMTRTIPLAADQLAQIAAAGGQLGLDADALPAFTETVAKAATAFDMLPEAAGDAFAKLSNVYAIPIEQIGSLGDAINTLSNNTAAKASEIVEATQRIGGTGRQFGLSAEQVAALSATMIGLGKSPEVAGTGINALLTKLQTATKQGKPFQAALKQMGISAQDLEQSIGQDAQGALAGFLGQLSQIDTQSRAGLLVDLFGLEYADDVSALAGSMDKYSSALGMVADEQSYAGSMQAEFAARAATTSNGLMLLSNRVAELKRAFGAVLLPIIADVAARLGGVIDKVKAWTTANPELTRRIVTVAAALAALLVVGGGAALVLSGLTFAVSQIGTAFTVLRAGIALIGPAFGLISVPVLAVVAVLVGAVLLIRKYWEPISGFFRGLWAGLTEGLAPISEAFSAAFAPLMPILQPVLDGLAWLWDKVTGLLTPVRDVDGAAEAMGRRWGEAIAAMIAKVGELLGALLALPGKLLQVGRDIVSGLWSGMQEKWGAMSAWLAEKTGGLLGTAKQAVDAHSPSRKFLALGADIVRGLQMGIESLAPGALAAVRGLATGLAAVPLALAPMAAPAMSALSAAPMASAAVPALSALSAAPITAAMSALSAAPMASAAAQAQDARSSMPSPAADPRLSIDDVAGRARDTRRAQWLEQARTRASRGARPNVSTHFNPSISISSQTTRGMDERGLADLVQQRMQDQLGEMTRTQTGFFDDPDEV